MKKKVNYIKKATCLFLFIFMINSWLYAQEKQAGLKEVTLKATIPLKYPEHLAFLTSVSTEGKMNIMTIGWYMFAGRIPPKFAIAVNKSRYTHELISKTKEFVLAYPTEDMQDEILYCGTHTGRKVDKFKETKLTPVKGKTVKAPLIKECKANFECNVIDTLDTGSYTLFIGEILHSWVNPELKNKKRIYNLGNRNFKGLP